MAGKQILPVGDYNVDVSYNSEIGKGGFGTIYRASHPKFKDIIIAAKKIDVNVKTKSEREVKNCLNMLKFCNDNNNIIEIFDAMPPHNDGLIAGIHAWIFSEYCEEKDLNIYFNNHYEEINLHLKTQIMSQISNGLEYLHVKKIAHRDIKPENLLVKRKYENVPVVKISDYGLSKFLDHDADTSGMNTDAGTNMYKAPEFWDGSEGSIRYHKSIDIFSTGLTFLAMIQHAEKDTGLRPRIERSCEKSEKKLPIGQVMYFRKKSKQVLPPVVVYSDKDDELTGYIKDAIEKMVRYNPKDRLTASQLHQKMQDLCGFSIMKVK